ncbi:cyclodeaminase/cyclohydrolase family protein [Clostridium thermobutyricum]|uniref:Methenyltetrahydrofolate cyclohydrolase n=1 Tax=Clostridium thermobutyricum DSM 4928 TaxID=1121339 RepID=A0A1V4SVE0_9CLOT|nr:cyclodeaminase/cyclohydrolase family protein [Clostridium thermobutyricum]OPX47965.1 methenyltetrahydrofolate cyclohydrolase [Clostridium thermobutyricum DSM 4928]
MIFKDYKIEEFINDLASDSPAPGGGSTAALVGALSGALNSMVYSLTVGKKSFEKLDENKKEELLLFKIESEKFIKRSIELMEEDRKAFSELMNGYKIPKEKEDREEKIQKLTIGALMAPLKMSREALKFYENIKFGVTYGNKMLVSDGGVSAILLHSTIESSILNVMVNLKYINDLNFKKEIEEEIENTMKVSLEKKNEIMKLVYSSVK